MALQINAQPLHVSRRAALAALPGMALGALCAPMLWPGAAWLTDGGQNAIARVSWPARAQLTTRL